MLRLDVHKNSSRTSFVNVAVPVPLPDLPSASGVDE